MAIDPKEDLLDGLLSDARQDGPSPDLMARVAADAAQVQAQAEAGSQRSKPARGWFQTALGAIGGWPGLSGVTAAGVMGIALGFYAPDMIDTLSGGQLWTLTGGAGATPDIGTLWAEVGDV